MGDSKILEKILVTVQSLETSVGTLKEDVGVLKTDVGTLKSDVGTLKTDVGTLKTDVSELKTDVGTLKTDVKNINVNLNDVFEIVTFIKDNAVTQEEFKELEKKVTRIDATMVTKEYLDKKMSEQRGEIVNIIRQEDTKVMSLVTKLHHRNVLQTNDVKELSGMQPFPAKI